MEGIMFENEETIKILLRNLDQKASRSASYLEELREDNEQVTWRSVVVLGIVLAAALVALVLGNENIAVMLVSYAVGLLTPSPIKAKRSRARF